CAPGRHRLALNDFIEWAALDQFHAEIAATGALADFVNRNDAGMIEPGCGLRFQMEALQMPSGSQLTQRDDLQCDGAIEAFLSCSIHKALSTATEFFEQFVVAKVGHVLARVRIPVIGFSA